MLFLAQLTPPAWFSTWGWICIGIAGGVDAYFRRQRQMRIESKLTPNGGSEILPDGTVTGTVADQISKAVKDSDRGLKVIDVVNGRITGIENRVVSVEATIRVDREKNVAAQKDLQHQFDRFVVHEKNNKLPGSRLVTEAQARLDKHDYEHRKTGPNHYEPNPHTPDVTP